MALGSTHIRFAADLKDKFKINNLEKYISGTIYPDSRYITKINRKLTHNPNFINKDFYGNNDFKKGWIVHLICDKLQDKVMESTFPALLKGKIEQGNEVWVTRTALKIIQDIRDFNHFNIQDYIDYLNYVETPNNENVKKIKEYNQIIIDMYKGKSKISIKDNFQIWLKFGLSKELATKIDDRAEGLEKDKELVRKLKNNYDKMIKLFYENRQFIRSIGRTAPVSL